LPLKNTQVQLDAPIFDPARRSQAISNALTRVAKKYVKSQKDKHAAGPHTGTQYKRPGVTGASRFHQASRRGERPAPDTLRLMNAMTDQKVSATEHEAFVDDAKAKHGDYLTRPRLARLIMTDQDAAEAEQGIMREEMERVQAELNGD
jgi:hypothetical protein